MNFVNQKVTSSDWRKAIGFTIEIDMKKFKLRSRKSCKAKFHQTMDVALIKKDDSVFQHPKKTLNALDC